MSDLNEEQKEVLDKLVEVSDTAQEAIDDIGETLEKLKEQLSDPETRVEVMLSIIKNATDSFSVIDKQFTDIALSMESLFRGHNELVTKFNETVGSREWLASVVDSRLADRERLAMEEHQIVELKNKFTVVRHGSVSDDNKPKLEVGQIRTYIQYPASMEQLTEEDIDLFSSNKVVTLEEEEGEYKEVSKKENVILFSAASLLLSEFYTSKVQEGELKPTLIKTIDGSEYLVLDIYLDMEIQSTSTPTWNEEY